MDTQEFPVFCNMVDELILERCHIDPELADGFKWMDERARIEGMDLYDMVYKVLLNYENTARAAKWLRDRE